MIIRRKKPAATPGHGQPAMRSRDSAENTDNPLARRFPMGDEPDTIDLQQATGFNSGTGTTEPATSPAGQASTGPAPAASEHLSVVTLDPGSGKLYVQPGEGDSRTRLGEESVSAATELRRGDRIRVGGFELQIFQE